MEQSDQKKQQENPTENVDQVEINSHNYKDWQIDYKKEGKQMIDHRRNPGYNGSYVIDYNDEILEQIKKAYPEAKITTPMARYRQKDEERYCRLRKIDNEPDGSRGKKGRVKDHNTIIYLVADPGKQDDEFECFDAVTIKPPPYDEDEPQPDIT